MGIPLEKLLADFSGRPGATEEILQTVERSLGLKLPGEYRSFLGEFNGGKGFIKKHYLVLWKAEELFQFNRDYQVERYAAGLFIFGSDGGGEGFAFDTRSISYRVMQVPSIGMKEDARFVADSFNRLLERMFEIDGSLF
jgi:hypothetical protein